MSSLATNSKGRIQTDIFRKRCSGHCL